MTADQALDHPWIQKQHDGAHIKLDARILTSLRTFSKFSTFKRAALEVIAFSLNATQMENLRDLFIELDTDHTGTLSISEIEAVLRDQGLMRAEIERIFQVMDQDGTKQISYSEWLAASLDHRLYLTRERIKEAFERYVFAW